MCHAIHGDPVLNKLTQLSLELTGVFGCSLILKIDQKVPESIFFFLFRAAISKTSRVICSIYSRY